MEETFIKYIKYKVLIKDDVEAMLKTYWYLARVYEDSRLAARETAPTSYQSSSHSHWLP